MIIESGASPTTLTAIDNSAYFLVFYKVAKIFTKVSKIYKNLPKVS